MPSQEIKAQIPPKISTKHIFSQIPNPYNPKLIAILNDETEVRVAKILGDFVWHSHTTTDELFLVLSGGPLIVRIRHVFGDEGSEEKVVLDKGELFVVPAGTQHMPGADKMAEVLIVERKGEPNTGDLGVTERTVHVEDVR